MVRDGLQPALRLAGAPGAVFLRISGDVVEMTPGEALGFAEEVRTMALRAICAGQREPRSDA